MFETPEARLLILLREMHQEMREMREEMAIQLEALNQRLDQTSARIDALRQEGAADECP